MGYRATKPPFIRMLKHSEIAQSFQILHKLALKTLESFRELKVRRRHEAVQFKEQDQFRLERHQGLSAWNPVAHFDELIYSAQATQPRESNQLRLERHQGLSAQSPAAHFDEFVYSGQVTLHEESDQLRLHCHSATAPRAQQLTLTSSSTLDRSRYLRSQISSGYIATRPQHLEPSSSL